jgi:hypothetical protein
MKRRGAISVIAGVAVIVLLRGGYETSAGCVGNPSCPSISSLSDFPPEIPHDWTCEQGDVTILGNHPDFKRRFMDIYSWKVFVTLMRPALRNGNVWNPQNAFPTQAQTQTQITDPHDSSGVDGVHEYVPYWATWKNRPDVFGGNQPNTVERFDINADGKRDANGMVPSLFDKDGKQVYYEILVNGVVSNKIADKTLNTLQGQEDFAKKGVKVQFKPGQCQPTGSSLIRGPIELKLAWKELGGQNENPDHFLKRTVKIKDTTGTVHPVTAGLVGLHITHQTGEHMTWIWSTFEHVNNDHTFDNTSCTSCPYNTPPNGGSKDVRLKRTESVAQETEELNTAIKQLFASQNSVLQYYKLIGTQYVPTGKSTGTNAQLIANMEPQLLRNLVIEPYVTQSSCIGCHLGAQIPSRQCVPPQPTEDAEEDKIPRVSAAFSFFIQNGLERSGLCQTTHTP